MKGQKGLNETCLVNMARHVEDGFDDVRMAARRGPRQTGVFEHFPHLGDVVTIQGRKTGPDERDGLVLERRPRFPERAWPPKVLTQGKEMVANLLNSLQMQMSFSKDDSPNAVTKKERACGRKYKIRPL